MEKGTISLQSAAFSIQLLKSSQTLFSLSPKADRSFDFAPKKFLQKRSSDGFYHLGDITLRLRTQGDGEWKKYSTAVKRAPITELPIGGKILAAANLASTFASDLPLTIKRYWELENGDLVLRFELINAGKAPIEIGSLGIPLIFNNILDGQSLDSAHKHNVFYDPYIGMDAGYLQVTRLSGKGPALLVIPYGKTPFEGYSPLLDDPSPRSITFEGFHEWMPFTAAHASADWKNALPWNKPNTLMLKVGEKRSVGLKFILASSIKAIEQKLTVQKRPVAVGIPGYVVPQDVDAKLFLKYTHAVKSLAVYPENALTVKKIGEFKNGNKAYQVKGNKWGRARLTITYSDGLTQTVHYKIVKPENELVSDFGHFLTTKQWFDDANDPFHRAPSVISYDYDTKTQVTQDRRAWIAGLGDEGGSGSWLGAMMKQLIQPDKVEVQKMERFATETMWGRIQSNNADSSKYGVRKSLFYYEPKEMPEGTYSSTINFKTWSAWPKKEANSLGRSYNYPHVAAAHWVLYRLARYHTNLVTQKDWKWYLENAFQTSMAMVSKAPYYAQFGQMEGSVFLYILKDLKAEGMVQMASDLEKTMKKRADHWRSLNYPFGSEMPWDSTGQEEVYMWSAYFGYQDKADVTLNAILGYMPTVPHWGYNGSARRYWDFLYGGKLSRVERQLHHYGSGLNAIPVLTAYRHTPADLYLLRVGYGGLMGSIANITEDGFGPAAFHSFPSTLQIDGLSGDYGPNFYGYAVNSATYITKDPAFGWLAFGGNLTQSANAADVKITTAAKSKVFLSSLGLWLTLDAGSFTAVSYNPLKQTVEVTLDAGDAFTPKAYLNIEQNDTSKGKFKPKINFNVEKGAYVIPLQKQATKVLLSK
ncbi:MAG: hypothetical protein EOO07_06435 [Chitinophagaceae bacterium]|nr:MAG: hypothetical protein EOO07_06435 [Chitinophagaceae bacterium]